MAFVDVPPLLRQILEHEMSGQPDFEVLPDDAVARRVAGVVPPPDAIILATKDTKAAGHARMLLDRWPHAGVLVFTRFGRSAALYRRRHRRIDLGQISASEAAQAIRDAFNGEHLVNS